MRKEVYSQQLTVKSKREMLLAKEVRNNDAAQGR
jgi:hypothetical protein